MGILSPNFLIYLDFFLFQKGPQLGPLGPNPLAGFWPWSLGPLRPHPVSKGSNRAQGTFGAQAPLLVAQGPDPGASEEP